MKNLQFTSSIKFGFKETGFLPNDTAKGLFLFLISQTLVTLVYQVLYMVGFTQSIWSYVFTLILDACFVAVVYNIAKVKKIDFWSSIRARRAPKLVEVLIALGISLVCIFGFSAITNLFMEFLYSVGYTSVSSDIVIPNFGYYLLYVVFICIVPAISEEILFRGLIANGLKRVSAAVAVFGSAFLFMIMHGSPDQTVHQFILGIVLALVFLISDNIWVPILVHFFNNFIAVTFAYISYGANIGGGLSSIINLLGADAAGDLTTPTDTVYSIRDYLGEYIIYAIISAIISGCLLYLLFKALSNVRTKAKEVQGVEVKESTYKIKDPSFNYFDEDASFGGKIATEGSNGEEITMQMEKETLEYRNEESPNKITGAGKTMYIISIVWLVMDWISALVLGLTTLP